jgi:hypothetical protein
MTLREVLTNLVLLSLAHAIQSSTFFMLNLSAWAKVQETEKGPAQKKS